MNDELMFVIFFAGIFGLIGVIFFIIGIAMLKNRKKKELNCTTKTYGKVRDIVRSSSRDSNGRYSSYWHPVFEYNVGELTFVKESAFGSSQSKYAIGQTVEIYYNPKDYNEFYVAEEKLQNFMGKMFTIIGSVIMVTIIIISILVMCF